MAPGKEIIVAILLICPCMVLPQEATQNQNFYMDTVRDCNGQIRNIFDKQATVHGHSSTDIAQIPLTCELSIETENNFEKRTFKVTIIDMNIKDPDVNFYIYDGSDRNQLLLASYRMGSQKPTSAIFTTGSTVTVVLTRQHNENQLYSIQVRVEPLVSGQKPGYENDNGQDYGYFNRMVPKEIIYGIVSAAFGLIIIIVIIVVIVCYRKQRGLSKPAQEYKISYINSGASMTPGRGPNSDMASTRSWVTASRNSLRRDRKPRRTSEESDSVFDGSVDSIPTKKRYYPEDNYRYRNSRPSDDRYDPYYEKSRNHSQHDRYRNDSFVQADDDHPQETFVERVIEPRVKTKPRLYEREEEDVGVGPDEEEEEEESENEEESEEEEEEEEAETEEEDVDHPELPAPHHDLPEHPPPRIGVQSAAGMPQPKPRHFPPQEGAPQPHSYPMDPRQMPPGGMYPPGYAMYPGQPRPQFVAVPTGPGQFQPIQAYPPNIPPPRYPGNPQVQPPNQPYQVKPTDPPVYSYLVQRGYNPVDGRDSPVSVSTNASAHSDTRLLQPNDSDQSGANLDPGVEFMRR